jgi:hypothetical protein
MQNPEIKKMVLLKSVSESLIITDIQKTDISNYVNILRAKHQSPPLIWDDTIMAFSQQWANYLLLNNLFQHSGSVIYGENLAYFAGYGTDLMTLVKKAIDMWYNEISLYDFKKPGFSGGTGHFTCLVWKSSKIFSMGISINTKAQSAIITMNTSPPGNYVNDFAANVLPLITLPAPPAPPAPLTPPPIAPVLTDATKRNLIKLLLNVIYEVNTYKNKTDIVKHLQDILLMVSSA